MAPGIFPVTNALSERLAHCERRHPQGINGIELGLDRVQRVARRMELAVPCPVITVAGTNGKGSTCAMLEAICSEAGQRTGVYTSPHLMHFEERCSVGREAVPADALLPTFAEVERARLGDGGSGEPGVVVLTYFEFTTLAILRTLSECGIDGAILEIGMGGRRDAVNILDPNCAVTPASRWITWPSWGLTAKRLVMRRPASCAPAARWW